MSERRKTYAERRAAVLEYAAGATKRTLVEVTVSPCFKYELRAQSLDSGSERHWNYTSGAIVRRSDGHLVCEVIRNYSSFWHEWVVREGETYLLCGEDYQGQTVVRCRDGEKFVHVPDDAERGAGFCWASAKANDDGTLLAVTGCVWGGPFEWHIYDIRDVESLPYPLLHEEFSRGEEGPAWWEHIDDGEWSLYIPHENYDPKAPEEFDYRVQQIRVRVAADPVHSQETTP